MFQILDQQDNRWNAVKLGASPFTVGRYGCAITSLCNLSNWFYGYVKTTPDMLASNAANFDGATGDVFWEHACAQLGNLKYAGSQTGEVDDSIDAAIAAANRGVILEVNNGAHFVMGWDKPWLGQDFRVCDPWYGKLVMVKKTFHNVSGAFYFIKI